MYAIIEIANKQFKVSRGQYLFTPRLIKSRSNTAVIFDKVLVLESKKDTRIGNPIVEGAQVVGKVLEHGRGDKIMVFKKKRRKGYKKQQGHRQHYSKVLIEDIIL